VVVGVKKSRFSGFEVLRGRKIQVYEREIGVRDFPSAQRLQPLEELTVILFQNEPALNQESSAQHRRRWNR
jgi:hypothetical protein